MSAALQTIKDFIRWGASRFNAAHLAFGHGTDNAIDEAAYLVLHSLHLPLDLAPQYLDCRVTQEEEEGLRAIFERRIQERLPAPYLTHEAWFAGLSFHVDENVLIPRSPIAEMIENHFQPWLTNQEPGAILDLCTGSGCIAIACALQFPSALVDATDISAAALAVAEINRGRYGLEGQIRLSKSDLFQDLPPQGYDLIISNPPYVSAEQMQRLPPEYRHEPILGLAAGTDGLDAVRVILREAGDYLTEDGLLVVEVGESAQALVEGYPEVPFVWVEFSRGGEGVFVLSAEQLYEYRSVFELG